MKDGQRLENGPHPVLSVAWCCSRSNVCATKLHRLINTGAGITRLRKQCFPKSARFRRAWTFWGVISVGLVCYVALALIAAHPVAATFQLAPGNTVAVEPFRLFSDTFRFDLMFRANGCEQRPELGSWVSREDSGFLQLRPGAEIRIVASTPGSAPVTYEAMPQSGYCGDQNKRSMTANISLSPGRYRWPPPQTTPAILLHAGFNRVRLEITAVEQPLIGETVRLVILPMLTLESASKPTLWLWPAFLWPAFAAAQSVWAAGLLVKARPRRR
jgi:hypothetical protein